MLASRLTTCPIEAEEPEKVPSPPYCATMACEPTARLDVVTEALPPDSAADPRVDVPSRNCTLPLGVPVPELTVTEAVNVTDCPNWEGFKLLLTES